MSSAAYRRRRRPLSIAGVATAVAAAYGTYRLVTWAWKRWKSDDENEGSNIASTQRTVMASANGAISTQAGTQPLRVAASRIKGDYSARLRRRARADRLARCKIEVRSALSDFLPTLRGAVESRTDFAAETRELKRIRAARAARVRSREGSGNFDADDEDEDGAAEEEERERERELWGAVKVKSVARMIASAYAQTALLLVLTVQVHLLGGRLFLEEETQVLERQNRDQNRRENHGNSEQNAGSMSSLEHDSAFATEASEDMASYQKSHRIVLTRTYEFFFDRGVSALVEETQRAVSDVLAEWDVTDPSSMSITRQQFDDCINQIRSILEGHGILSKSHRRFLTGTRKGCLVRFIVQSDSALQGEVDDGLAFHILEETWDVLESPAFELAERNCLDVVFDVMREEGWSRIFSSGDFGGYGERWTARPLAQILTQLRHTANTFYGRSSGAKARLDAGMAPCDPNIYVARLQDILSLAELADASFD